MGSGGVQGQGGLGLLVGRGRGAGDARAGVDDTMEFMEVRVMGRRGWEGFKGGLAFFVGGGVGVLVVGWLLILVVDVGVWSVMWVLVIGIDRWHWSLVGA